MKKKLLIYYYVFLFQLLFLQKIVLMSLSITYHRNYFYLIYCKNVDISFAEFKKSYFWQKYKMTDQGKQLNSTFESLDSTFLIFGLTLDDLLEMFSEQALLSIWADNSNTIIDYLYFVKKGSNSKAINSFIERLEFFANANKINLIKNNYSAFQIYNFNNKVFLANSNDKKYVLIANNFDKIQSVIDRINSDQTQSLNKIDFPQIFKNKNLVTYLKLTNSAEEISGQYYYSFRFQDKPEIEGYVKYDNLMITNNNIDLYACKFIPNNIDLLTSVNSIDINKLIYPFLNNINTNLYKFDNNYFDPFFKKIKDYSDLKGICGMKLNNNNIDSVMVLKTNINRNNSMSYYLEKLIDANVIEEYKKIKIYKANEYFLVYHDYLLISNNLNFLKNSFDAYKNNNGFFYSENSKMFIKKNDLDILLWMDLEEYLKNKSLKHGDDKWYYYNAYMKTFKSFEINGQIKNNGIYFDLKILIK